MIRINLLALLILASVFSGFGQISISISTNQRRYISFEPVKVTVTLRNYSGHSLHFGDDVNGGGYLKFHIKNSKGNEIQPVGSDFNPVANLVLSAGIVKSITFSLTNYYALQGRNDFEIRARIGHWRLATDQISNPIYFQTRNGRSIWTRTVGLPAAPDGSVIKTRMCSLNVFNLSKGEIYFLKIEAEDYVQPIVRLGPKIIGIQPECDIDALSRVHTLVQTVPRLFKHRVFDLNGDLKQETAYIYESAQPRLVRDSEFGTIRVKGGGIAQEGIDYNIGRHRATTDGEDEEKKNQSGEDGFLKRTFKRFFKN